MQSKFNQDVDFLLADNVISFLFYGFFPSLHHLAENKKTRLMAFFVTYFRRKKNIFYWSLIYDIQHLAGCTADRRKETKQNVNGQSVFLEGSINNLNTRGAI